jgi:hypothetical protein
MKYFWIGALLVVLAGCNSPADESIQSNATVTIVDADSSSPIPRAMTELLAGYLQMKSLFPELTDTLLLRQHTQQMIVWADSLHRLSGTVSPPLGDSLQIMSMAISDELKGLMEETDKKGIGLSFQLTGLQLYDLLRVMRYSNGKVYFFQSMAGGEGEAGWLDITSVSQHPFLESGVKEKAVDSIEKR